VSTSRERFTARIEGSPEKNVRRILAELKRYLEAQSNQRDLNPSSPRFERTKNLSQNPRLLRSYKVRTVVLG
jgi:hypothetical protein